MTLDTTDSSRPRGVSILGSTGSIGRQALQVVDRRPDRLKVIALAAGSNVKLLAAQAEKYHPRFVAIADTAREAELRDRLTHLDCRVGAGPGALEEAATIEGADLVLAGMVGAAGILPTLNAVDAGRTVAVANKEVLVAAGAIVRARAAKSGAALLPVDSEHSAIFQCLHGQQRAAVRRVILTASGGPFARLDSADLEKVTPEQALNHPTWRMGDKITVDCATLMNKGLEIIEARWLFDLAPAQIDVIIHHQSIVHSLVEYADGSVLAQLGWPSMVLPIQYSLLYPDRAPAGLEPLDLARVSSLTFAKPDFDRFPLLQLAREALEAEQNYPAAMSAANEIAVGAFLDGRIGFTQIADAVKAAVDQREPSDEMDLDAVLEADAAGRATARAWIAAHQS
ncbi:MAG TPA: 1-deoxy-D-xylulose-5-phosphate reductoisomerase [Armatimonadota bacterium]|nr:1-deoxy-D-xylulose-5-phosphate reductoisomerase [Armatimonadota bacterium]